MGKRRYTEEFKREALKLVSERGISVAQAARELGVKQQTMSRWRQQVAGSAAPTGTASAADARAQNAELERLRRENVRLRAERDILKKALGYFAKEPS